MGKEKRIEDVIVLSGCSYMETSLPTIEPVGIEPEKYRDKWWVDTYTSEPNAQYFLQKKYNKTVHDTSIRGSSNESIFRRVYEYINYTKCINNKFVIQLTHLHRIGFQHTNPNCWLDFQAPPSNISGAPERWGVQPSDLFFSSIYQTELPILKTQKKLKVPTEYQLSKLRNTFYRIYLEHFYDDDNSELELIYKIQLLKSYIESTKNQVIFVGFPLYNNKILNDYIVEIDDDEKSFLRYAYGHDMISFEGHLNPLGSEHFADIIINKFNL